MLKFIINNIYLVKIKIAETTRNKNIFLAALTSFISKFVSVLVGLVTIPMTLQHLGTERFGIWMTISSIMAFLSFSDFGIGNSLMNLIAEAKGKNDKILSFKATSSAFFVLLLLSFIIFLLGVIFIYKTNWTLFFKVSSGVNLESEIKYSMLYFLIIFVINLSLSVIQKVQEGNQYGYIYSIFNIFGVCISLILVILSVHLKLELQYIIFANGIGPLISLIINLFYILKAKFIEFKISINFFDKSTVYKLFGTGSIFIILQLFSLITNYADNIIISRTLGVSFVPTYEVVRKLFMLSFITQFLLQPLWPAFKEAISVDDWTWVKNTFKKGMLYSLIASSIITLPLLFFGKIIIQRWVGKELEPSSLMLVGFYINILISNFGGVMSTLLNASDILSKQVPIIISATVLTIILKIVFSKTIGLEGVIWGTNIAYLIIYVPLTIRLVKKYIFKNQIT
jgi:O-antigen/teichoic acid export membrane protein